MQRKRPLRREAEIEDLLWLRLKALEECGWYFRKNSPFQTFVLPFVEHDALLVIELEADRAGRSPVRDRLLHEAGYTILRFPRADAQSNLPSVIAIIRAVLDDRKP
jgi:very-short-patch-repair endonuclease